ncbi:MAG: putative 4-hydroxybenzoate polyprenyltransferase [Deltaproteobacteria bacterium]|nr:putative 4-hydroxybenzoate polyprenyltransferase [Deltaproteobacteria bacterium]MCL5878241.1 putative 4-hydroxybenzoate polyprenyltransferase [Deltaproteobacteria bacterium]
MSFRLINKTKTLLEMIKFEHTLFAIPFAIIAMMLAANVIPTLYQMFWILIALTFARTVAMLWNRIVDAKVDARNPRTKNRAIPKGLVSVRSAVVMLLISCIVFVFSAYMLNSLSFILSFPALLVIFLYSYLKRFTWLSHFVLGFVDAMAPAGAWIAIRGDLPFSIILLSGAVILWVGGFDILYSLMDLDFDRKEHLFSIPVIFGVKRAIFLSRLMHILMVAALILFGVLYPMHVLYFTGIVFVVILLVYEHNLISPDDFSKVEKAFYETNIGVSGIMLFFSALDIFLKLRF